MEKEKKRKLQPINSKNVTEICFPLLHCLGSFCGRMVGLVRECAFFEYIVYIPLYKASTDESAHGNVLL